MQSRYPELAPERVEAALRGDREAFGELYRCYSPRVRAAVATALRFRSELARHFDDVLNEVWARLYANRCHQLRSYDPGRGTFGYYLYMRAWALARMLAAQVLRREHVVELDDPFVSLFAEDGLEGQVLGRDALERLYAEIRARLDRVDQTLFEEVYVKGRKIDEVGRELDLSKDAAYRRSHRLRAKIQRIADALAAGPGTGPPVPLTMLVAFVAVTEQLSDFHFIAP